MKVFSVEFVRGCLDPEEYPKGDLPEIAFVGRSNVGKSSVINTLLRQKGVARISATPGKTRKLFFFRINRVFYFVDLPGYGYARVPKNEKAAWAPSIEHYLRQRDPLRAVVFLLDARHPPTELDLQMKNWLERFRIRALIVLTKVDKISRGGWRSAEKECRKVLSLKPVQSVILFSAKTGEGREVLWHLIEKELTGPERT